METIISNDKRNTMETFSNAVATVASKPATGIIISINTTLLYWLGILTPYLAFITLVIGLTAAIYSLVHNRKQNKLDDLQIKVLEKQLNAKVKPLHIDD